MGNEIAKLAKRLKTPASVQRFLRSMAYNREEKGETVRSALSALKSKEAHCFEAAFIAALILEQHGYPPLVVSIESQDKLDHVIYVFKQKGLWGSIARSRDEGLHGRPPRYRSLRALVQSYIEPFIDKTGRIVGYQLANLDDTKTDWRFSKRNLWKAEKYLVDLPHKKLMSSDSKYKKLHKRYLENGPMKKKAFWW